MFLQIIFLFPTGTAVYTRKRGNILQSVRKPPLVLNALGCSLVPCLYFYLKFPLGIAQKTQGDDLCLFLHFQEVMWSGRYYVQLQLLPHVCFPLPQVNSNDQIKLCLIKIKVFFTCMALKMPLQSCSLFAHLKSYKQQKEYVGKLAKPQLCKLYQSISM